MSASGPHCHNDVEEKGVSCGATASCNYVASVNFCRFRLSISVSTKATATAEDSPDTALPTSAPSMSVSPRQMVNTTGTKMAQMKISLVLGIVFRSRSHLTCHGGVICPCPSLYHAVCADEHLCFGWDQVFVCTAVCGIAAFYVINVVSVTDALRANMARLFVPYCCPLVWVVARELFWFPPLARHRWMCLG